MQAPVGRKKLGVLREAIMLGMWRGEGRVVQAEVLAEDRDKERRIRKGKCSHCRKSFSSQTPLKSPKWRLPMSADSAFLAPNEEKDQETKYKEDLLGKRTLGF